MPQKLVTVAKYGVPADAQMAKMKLEASGIVSFIADEQMGSLLLWVSGGIRLQVAESDAERAKEVLRELPTFASLEEVEDAASEEE